MPRVDGGAMVLFRTARHSRKIDGGLGAESESITAMNGNLLACHLGGRSTDSAKSLNQFGNT
jgi:hypothetical protein